MISGKVGAGRVDEWTGIEGSTRGSRGPKKTKSQMGQAAHVNWAFVFLLEHLHLFETKKSIIKVGNKKTKIQKHRE